MSTINKAIAQALTGLLAWATAITVSEPDAITASEWVVLLGVGIGAFLVWLVPNQPAALFRRRDLGTSTLVTVLVVVALILLILWFLGVQVRVG